MKNNKINSVLGVNECWILRNKILRSKKQINVHIKAFMSLLQIKLSLRIQNTNICLCWVWYCV